MYYFLFRLFFYTTFLFINLLLSLYTVKFSIGLHNQPFLGYFWLILVYLLVYFFGRLFTYRTVNSQEFVLTLKCNLVSLLIIVLILFVSKTSQIYSRAAIFLFFLLNNAIPVYMYFTKKLFFQFPLLREPVLVVCDKDGLENIRQWLVKDNAFGFDVRRIVRIDRSFSVSKIDSLVDKYYAMIISASTARASRIFYFVDRFQARVRRIIVLPSLSNVPIINVQAVSSINNKGLAFFVGNNLLNPVQRFTKGVTDYILSIALFVLLFPVFLSVYIAVFLDTKGHPIFTQERIGLKGRRLLIYKFRTMRLDADKILKEALENNESLRKEWYENFKLKNDPRVTKLGNFLRKTSLDELPQFINILKGDMSLVGPRPIIDEEIEKYGEYFEYYKLVKPGLTGLWQVSGRNDVSYNERVMMDVWYVRNWSLALDLVILLKTIYSVISLKGSY